MRRDFLMVERIVLESLAEGAKDGLGLHLDTGLDAALIENVVHDLREEGFVARGRSGLFSLRASRVARASEGDAVKGEVKELFVSWVNRFFLEERGRGTCLRIQKVSMTEGEEELYREHLGRLDSFIEGVKALSRAEGRRGATARKKVVFWGHGEYRDLVESSMGSLWEPDGARLREEREP